MQVVDKNYRLITEMTCSDVFEIIYHPDNYEPDVDDLICYLNQQVNIKLL